MDVQIHPLTAEREADFYAFHGRAPVSDCDMTGWCYCVAWHVDPGTADVWQGWGERTAAQNRALRETLPYDGYLLYADGSPSGWCQVSPRDRLPRLCRLYRLEPDPAVWAVTCFMLHPDLRGKGLARRLLAHVLADLRAQGVQRVEAFPKRGSDDPWTGPERLFLGEGFAVLQDDEVRPVLELRLN